MEEELAGKTPCTEHGMWGRRAPGALPDLGRKHSGEAAQDVETRSP
jgi:hypothetical protein